jgi:hypothetical protein
MECRRKGALVSAGLSSPVQDKRNFFPGTVVDITMGRWLDLDSPERGWMATHVDEILDKAEVDGRESGDGIVKWRDGGDKTKVRVWCKELVTRLEPLLEEHVLPFDYEPHNRFKVPLTIPGPGGEPRQILLTGETDLRTWHPDKRPRSILDLKGTENSSYWRTTYPQLIFYEIATWGMTGHWPEFSGLIQPMCPEPYLPFYFTADQRREMFVTICAVANDVWTENLPPKADSTGCNRCPVKSACPKFAHGRGRVPSPA